MSKKNKVQFVVCIKNKDCEDLERLKIYRVLPDLSAKKEGYIRIVDESGEDYLYPASYFMPVALTPKVQEVLAA